MARRATFNVEGAVDILTTLKRKDALLAVMEPFLACEVIIGIRNKAMPSFLSKRFVIP